MGGRNSLLDKANGFYGSTGVSGRIPEGYTLLEQRFMDAVRQAGRDWDSSLADNRKGSGVDLNEWRKDGWTYHAKGRSKGFIRLDIVLILVF